MNSSFSCQVTKHYMHNHARVTQINTPHGEIMTPAFMPVGTRAYVNHMLPHELAEAGSQIILGGNTYHMLCAPGLEVIQALGGMHKMMAWQGPMLTDSGGFQVFSLSKNSKICTIKENGAHFKHPLSGQVMHLTPQLSIEAQKIIGADIIMAFDECTAENGDRPAKIAAMERTHRWLKISKEIHDKNRNSAYGLPQALFGIIQGGSDRALREISTEFILSMDLDGVAIGGESIGFDMAKTQEIIGWIRPALPDHQVRYTMGVGANPQDLIDVVAEGIDIFDCVAPTRNARHGTLYCGKIEPVGNWIQFTPLAEKGRVLIKKAIYAKDENPIMDDCACYTCHNYSRGSLHHLFKTNSTVYSHLACIHNIHVMHDVCSAMRKLILT